MKGRMIREVWEDDPIDGKVGSLQLLSGWFTKENGVRFQLVVGLDLG